MCVNNAFFQLHTIQQATCCYACCCKNRISGSQVVEQVFFVEIRYANALGATALASAVLLVAMALFWMSLALLLRTEKSIPTLRVTFHS